MIIRQETVKNTLQGLKLKKIERLIILEIHSLVFFLCTFLPKRTAVDKGTLPLPNL